MNDSWKYQHFLAIVGCGMTINITHALFIIYSTDIVYISVLTSIPDAHLKCAELPLPDSYKGII